MRSGVAGVDDVFVDAFGEPDFFVNLLKQNDTGVRGELAPVEIDGDGLDFGGRRDFTGGRDFGRLGVDFRGRGCFVGGFHGTLCLVVCVECALQFHCNVFDNHILTQRPLSRNPNR